MAAPRRITGGPGQTDDEKTVNSSSSSSSGDVDIKVNNISVYIIMYNMRMDKKIINMKSKPHTKRLIKLLYIPRVRCNNGGGDGGNVPKPFMRQKSVETYLKKFPAGIPFFFFFRFFVFYYLVMIVYNIVCILCMYLYVSSSATTTYVHDYYHP